MFGLALFSGCSADEKDNVSASIEVKGVVTSDLGKPLEAVLVKSAQDSAFTDNKGAYKVRTYPRGALEFMKAGYVKHIEPVEEQRVIDVTLKRILDGAATRYEARLVQLPCGDDTAAVASIVEVMDFGQGAGTITWTKNKVWVLKNPVFVNEGQKLTIEAGTIVKGAGGSPDSTGLLVVAKGGVLIANGTKELPIIFTAEADSILRDTTGRLCRTTSLSPAEKGLWGGLILCGSAPVHAESDSLRLDGFSDLETRIGYGGKNGDDNSGLLRHVSIRHAGRFTAGATLAGVGSGTSFEFVEIYACQSDGFRFLGGKMNTRHLVSAYNGGHAFWVKKGGLGLHQFWLAFRNNGPAYAGEPAAGKDSLVVANGTFIGLATEAQQQAAVQGGTGVAFHHCVFIKYAAALALVLEGQNEGDSSKVAALERLPVFKNCTFAGISAENFLTIAEKNDLTAGEVGVETSPETLFRRLNDDENGNLLIESDNETPFVPVEKNPMTGNLPLTEPFFEITNYRGCFAPGKPAWTMGWASVDGDL